MANFFRILHILVRVYDHGKCLLKRFSLFGTLFVVGLAVQLWARTDHRLLALAAFLVLLCLWMAIWHEVRRNQVKPYWIVAVVAIAIGMAVIVPPATSKDFNSYALYGRMVAEYEASPYTHEPVDFAGDAWFPRTSYFWSDSPSVYGPVFTAVSAGIMTVAETSVLKARLSFQSLAALALIGSVLLAARRIGKTRAMALIGLNPLLLTFGVNDAHCDVLIGFFVLAAVLSLERRRFLVTGVLLALAASVKIAVLPALAGAFVWIAFRDDIVQNKIRNAAQFAAGSLVTLVGLLLLAGGMDALSPLSDATGRHTRFSFWNPLHDLITNNTAASLPTHSTADVTVSLLASATVALVGIALILRHRKDVNAVIVVVVGLVTYQLLGAYVLSWYAAWSLPALALASGSRTFLLAMAHGSWVAIAYFSGFGGIAVLSLAAVIWLAMKRPNIREFWSMPEQSEQVSHNNPNRESLTSP